MPTIEDIVMVTIMTDVVVVVVVAAAAAAMFISMYSKSDSFFCVRESTSQTSAAEAPLFPWNLPCHPCLDRHPWIWKDE